MIKAAGHFKQKTGDTLPLTAVLRSKDGPVDLRGATVVLNLKPMINDVGPRVSEGACVVEQVNLVDQGKVRYEWGVNETDKPGICRAEFRVTFGDGTVETFPDGTAGDDYLTIEFVQDLA